MSTTDTATVARDVAEQAVDTCSLFTSKISTRDILCSLLYCPAGRPALAHSVHHTLLQP